jgi:hypothetical protein
MVVGRNRGKKHAKTVKMCVNVSLENGNSLIFNSTPLAPDPPPSPLASCPSNLRSFKRKRHNLREVLCLGCHHDQAVEAQSHTHRGREAMLHRL